MAAGSLIEGALRRDRLLVVLCLLVVVGLSWAWLLAGAGMTQPMGDMLMPMSSGPWTLASALVVLAMWAVMMAAMMLPSAAPMILLHATIAHRRRERGGPATAPAGPPGRSQGPAGPRGGWAAVRRGPGAESGAFALGYLVVWAGFSLAAAALQFALEQAALLSPMMQTTSIALAGAVLIAAGLYQWTPLKQACLRHCRSPLDFLVSHWRPGADGALRMGLRHGAVCVGCCWMLMLLLFIGGVMNLAWVAGIAAFVLVEKLSPAGHWIGRGAGVLLVAWGAATLVAAS